MSADETKRNDNESARIIASENCALDWLKALGISEAELLDVIYGVDDTPTTCESTYTSGQRASAKAA